MKPFKTHRQQLTILRSRGLLVNNGSKAIRILERENYYTVINGYKDFFLLAQIGAAVIGAAAVGIGVWLYKRNKKK